MDQPERPIDRLLRIMRRLRSPGGCPWDREQTLTSLKPFLLEECHEELEAIDSGDRDRIREELGDVLLQIVFQSQICEEAGWFSFDDVAAAIAAKLIRRHPHVFGDLQIGGADDVLRNWEAIKRSEKAGAAPRSVTEGIPRSLPALRRADQVQRRAARVGFDWPNPAGVLDKLDEEIRELREAAAGGDRKRISDELGDLLFTLVNMARAWQLDAEDLLKEATDKFIRRFRHMEEHAEAGGKSLSAMTAAELDALWTAAKQAEAGAAPSGPSST